MTKKEFYLECLSKDKIIEEMENCHKDENYVNNNTVWMFFINGNDGVKCPVRMIIDLLTRDCVAPENRYVTFTTNIAKSLLKEIFGTDVTFID